MKHKLEVKYVSLVEKKLEGVIYPSTVTEEKLRPLIG